MQAEILNYSYTKSWNLDEVITDFKSKNTLQPHWPLVSSTVSSFTNTEGNVVWSNFLAGKRRGRPSELRNSTIDSTFSYIANQLGLNGPVMNVQAACAGSIHALYNASLMSQDLQTPVVVFCGDNLLTDYWIWHFNSLGALNQETGRPFDSTSKGFRLGQGAVLFLIKHPSVKSNVGTRAVIQSFHFYTNPELVSNPGLASDIIKNLGNIDYKRVEFWNAHATGTPVGDKTEYEYFSSTIKQDIPIVSYKGHIGHCIGGAGAMEIALALEGKSNNILLPNNIQGDKIVNDDRIITSPTSFNYTRMLKTSLGFGGKTAAIEVDLY